jgi:hypothetical protein
MLELFEVMFWVGLGYFVFPSVVACGASFFAHRAAGNGRSTGWAVVLVVFGALLSLAGIATVALWGSNAEMFRVATALSIAPILVGAAMIHRAYALHRLGNLAAGSYATTLMLLGALYCVIIPGLLYSAILQVANPRYAPLSGRVVLSTAVVSAIPLLVGVLLLGGAVVSRRRRALPSAEPEIFE